MYYKNINYLFPLKQKHVFKWVQQLQKQVERLNELDIIKYQTMTTMCGSDSGQTSA